MSELIQATPSMFEEIVPLLEAQFPSPPRSREQWQRLFRPPWEPGGDFRGYALKDGPRIVGFLGMLFSEREIHGRRRRFCNLTSFTTDKDHRHESLSLLAPILKLADCTLTNFTPSEAVFPLFERLGFRVLDRRMHILLPLPEPLKALREVCGKYRVTSSPAKIRARLAGEELKIFEDHQLPHIHHLLVHGPDGCCHVVFNRTRGRRRTFACVQHLSRPDIFLANLNRVKWCMGRTSGTPFIMILDRFLQGPPPAFVRSVDIRHPALFKSASLEARDIDGLYSELLLLDL